MNSLGLNLTRSFGSDLGFGVTLCSSWLLSWASIDRFKTILSLGVTFEPTDAECERALLRATAGGQTKIVSYFLRHGFDVNGTYETQFLDDDDDASLNEENEDDPGRFLYSNLTLLIHSVIPWYTSELQPSSMTKLLLDLGAEVDTVGSKGRTALAEVARQGLNISKAKLLINRGANPLVGLGSGKAVCALEWAILKPHPEMVELFLQSIADRGY